MSRRKPRQMGVPQRCRGRSDAIQRCAPPERPLSGGATDCSRPKAVLQVAALTALKQSFTHGMADANRSVCSTLQWAREVARRFAYPEMVVVEGAELGVETRRQRSDGSLGASER